MILNEAKVDGFGSCLCFQSVSIQNSNTIDDSHRVEGELLMAVSQKTDHMTRR